MFRLGYISGAALMLAGLLMVIGYFDLPGRPEDSGALRMVFGVVLLLIGLYRIVSTQLESNRRRREGEYRDSA